MGQGQHSHRLGFSNQGTSTAGDASQNSVRLNLVGGMGQVTSATVAATARSEYWGLSCRLVSPCVTGRIAADPEKYLKGLGSD